jgi:hypothetical protein
MAQTTAKRLALAEWVKAINGHAGFGRWTSEVARAPLDIADHLEALSLNEG